MSVPIARRAAVLFSSLVLCLPALASAPAWLLDKAHSRLLFKTTVAGEDVEGVFTRWDADVRFDPQDVGASSIKVNVDAASAATGDAERDQALPSADWFDAKRFASATYETQSISDLGDGKYEATGTLTLRGTSRAVPLRFTFTVADGVATMKVQSALTRTDFGVGQGQFATGGTVSADVAVEAELRLTRKP